MPQDLPLASIIEVLKQVVQQSPASLEQAVGTEGMQAAQALYQRVDNRLDPVTMKKFRERPERTGALSDDLQDAIEQHPDFAQALRDLYAQYTTAVQQQRGGESISANISGSPGAQQAVGSGNVQVQGGGVAAGGDINADKIAGHDMHIGDQHTTDESIHIGSMEAGIANVGKGTQNVGDVAGRDHISVGGNVGPGAVVGSGSVQADNIAGGDITIGVGGDELAQIFAGLRERVQKLPADDRSMVEPVLEQTKEQAEKIAAGDESKEAQNALAERLKVLKAMAPDIGDVAIATLANPALGIAMVIKKVAAKVKQETEGAS